MKTSPFLFNTEKNVEKHKIKFITISNQAKKLVVTSFITNYILIASSYLEVALPRCFELMGECVCDVIGGDFLILV